MIPASLVRRCTLASLMLLALLPACKQAAAPSPSPATSEPPASTATQAGNDNKEANPVDTPASGTESERPPSPDAVMYFIYRKDGDGATSYEIENGSVATYWHGQRFDLSGKQYFTGFAYNTPEKFSQAEKDRAPDPLTRVTLTQATFIADKPGTEKPWRAISAELFIGEFGGAEKPNQVDDSRQPVSKATGDGRLVLAIPTLPSGAAGESGPLYSLFRFNPGELTDPDDRHWWYLGDVPVAPGDSTLEFVPSTTGGMLPDVKVKASAAPEGVPLDPDGTLTYVYDEDSKAYLVLQ